MDIDEEKIRGLISKIGNTHTKAAVASLIEVADELKALIEPEKWEPKEYEEYCWIDGHGGINEHYSGKDRTTFYGNNWPTKELATIARDMNKRNQLILQAKHEIGAEDGDWIISFDAEEDLWCAQHSVKMQDNPELTFKTDGQAEQVIKMVRLNANPS